MRNLAPHPAHPFRVIAADGQVVPLQLLLALPYAARLRRLLRLFARRSRRPSFDRR